MNNLRGQLCSRLTSRRSSFVAADMGTLPPWKAELLLCLDLNVQPTSVRASSTPVQLILEDLMPIDWAVEEASTARREKIKAGTQ